MTLLRTASCLALLAALGCSGPSSGGTDPGTDPGTDAVAVTDAGVELPPTDTGPDTPTPPGDVPGDPGPATDIATPPADLPAPSEDVTVPVDPGPGEDVADSTEPAYPACCGPADPCPGGFVCGGYSDLGPGACLPKLSAGQCWGQDDCTAMEACVGVTLCPCEAACANGESVPGVCKNSTEIPIGACCAWDGDCSGGPCVGALGGSNGQCAGPLTAGRCFDLSDCTAADATHCEGAVVAACEQGIYAVAGTCQPGNVCCVSSDDCPSGVCADNYGMGACLESPPDGRCWQDGDCTPGTWCEGGFFCPCSTQCDTPDTPGTCVALPTGCCMTNADCGQDLVCVGLPGEFPWRCLPDPAGPACPGGGCCWDRDGCPEDPPNPGEFGWCWYCVDASICPCGEAGPDGGRTCTDTMGHCETNGCI